MELERIGRALQVLAGDDEQMPSSRLVPGSGRDMHGFRYSFTELSVHNGSAHLRHAETRFENGRLSHEELEGPVDAESCAWVFESSERAMRTQMTRAMQLLLQSFPFWPRR